MGRKVTPRVDVEPVEWATSVREVFQDAHIEAVEEAQYHTTSKTRPSGTSGAETAAEKDQHEQETRERDERALLPAVRRLQHIYRTEIVSEEGGVAEEQWALFLDELWLAMGRVLVAPKLHVTTLGTVASLIGMFLRTPALHGKHKNVGEVVDKAVYAEEKEEERETVDPEQEEEAKSMQELRSELLNRLMEATKAEDKIARLRSCQMLQIILNKMEYIEEELFAHLQKVMLPRASDKLATIRMQSLLVLTRLQDAEDATDPVTAELQRLMVTDPSKDVRKAAVMNVAVTKSTLRDLLVRIRDVSDEVRAAAFYTIRERLRMKDIPFSDRAQLLDQGLQDRSSTVRTACEQMLVEKWLKDSNHSPARLLRSLDVEHFTDLCTRVSKILLKFHLSNHPFEPMLPSIDVADVLAQRDNGGKFTGDIKDAFDGASVFFWREQCVFFHDDEKDEEKLATLLPSISDYIKVLAIVGDSEEDMTFVIQQLLALGRSLDFQDEYGRRNLLESLRKLVADVSLDSRLVPGIMELMANIYAVGHSQRDFVRVIAEIMSDLYDPLDSENQDPGVEAAPGLTDEEREAATDRFDQLAERLETLEYESEEYLKVQQELDDLEKLLQDPKVVAWLRCLEILAQLLKLTNYNLKHPVISGVGRYILPAIESDVPAIREHGMECLGLFCLLDRNVAERHLVVFWRALNNEEEERDVKLSCIRAIMDMVFSFANLKPQVLISVSDESREQDERGVKSEDTGADAAPTLKTEELHLDTVFMYLAQLATTTYDDLEVQSTIVEGFSKLFLMHRLRSPSVLSVLLETFFSPRLQKVQLLSEHGYQARSLQLMSVFFPTFVEASSSNCSLFEEGAIYLIQTSIEKHEPSDAARDALNQIDLSTSLKYLFHLLSHSDEPPNIILKKQDAEDGSSIQPIASAANQKCAHHNRVAINMCVDILAIEKLRKATPKIDAVELDSRQKLLLKLVVFTDISAAETRSALLLLHLLKSIIDTCFRTNKTLVKTLEALHKRLTATYALGCRQLGKAARNESVLEQDQNWADERIEERATKIRMAIKEYMTSRRRLRRSSAGDRRSASSRRRDDSSESDSDEEGDDDDSDDEDDQPVQPRRASSRQSKARAVDRMRSKNRDFDVAMKIAFEDSDGENEEDEEEDEDDDESDEESDEESNADENKDEREEE